MKKILLLALIILNVSLLTVYASDEKIVVNDDYEKYEIGAQPEGWTMTNDKEGGIYGDIEQDPNNPENKILVLHSNGTDVRCYRNFEAVGGFTTIECRVKLSDNGNNGVHWVASSDVFLFNMLYQRGFTIKNASVNKAIPNFVVDFTKWYDIKYELDFSNQTFNYYLNGAIVLQDSPFWIPDTMSINRIFFGINNNTICIDDFKITSKGEIEKVYTGISSSKYYIHNFNRKIWESHSDTLLSDFMPKLNFVEGAVVTVLDSDRETEYHGTYVKDGMFVRVQSPNGKQNADYEVNTRARIIGKNTLNYLKNAVVFYDGSPYVIADNIRTVIDGKDKNARVFDKDGVRYIPLRALCEGFGYSIDYDGVSNMISVNDVLINPNENGYTKNGKDEKQNERCIVSDGITYIPLSWAEDITDKMLIYNEHGVTVLRSEDYPCRQSIKNYIVKETIKWLTED